MKTDPTKAYETPKSYTIHVNSESAILTASGGFRTEEVGDEFLLYDETI